MSNLPSISIRDLMDSGVHFGHKTMRWNPKMQPYIYGQANNIHIIDLQKTAPMLHKALGVARDVAAKNGKILFVATKRQASQTIGEAAERCGQFYTNYRWMGGMLTNWNTVSRSIKTLNTFEAQLVDPELNLSKKEKLQKQREISKLNKALGGIRKMGGKPDLMIVIDTNREKIAILEARKLKIPVIAIVDTNCDPDGIDHIVPGNDDSIKSIRLYANLFSDAILQGLQKSLGGLKKIEEKTSPSSSESKTEAKKEEKTASIEIKKGKKLEKKSESEETPAKKEEVKSEEKKTEVKKTEAKKEEVKKTETKKAKK